MAELLQGGLTRRQMLKAGGTAAAAAGYALSVETVLAQAIKTDTQGIIAGDQVVKVGSHNMTLYEARPESFTSHPIVLVISEVWGVHE
jgi:carboxymethylenebutenolidase